MYGGASAEQFVGQEISAANHTELYFWSREAKNSSAEIEFLIERRGQILPIEVKSGVSEKLKDLHILLKTYQNVLSGYVLSAHPFSEIPEQKLYSVRSIKRTGFQKDAVILTAKSMKS